MTINFPKLLQHNQSTVDVYQIGDIVHWIETASVVDYDRIERAIETRHYFGVVLEVGDFGMVDGAIRGRCSKFYYADDGSVVEYGFSIVDSSQIVPPGTFR